MVGRRYSVGTVRAGGTWEVLVVDCLARSEKRERTPVAEYERIEIMSTIQGLNSIQNLFSLRFEDEKSVHLTVNCRYR